MILRKSCNLITLCFLMGACLNSALAESGRTQAAVTQEALGQTLSKISQSGVIYLAHRESSVPFSYVIPESNTPVGYSWEICQHVVKAVEKKLGKEIQVVPVNASSFGRMMQVKVNMSDLECGSTTNTVGRQNMVNFSTTIFVSEVRILVRANSGIKTAEDLRHKRIVTTSGTNSDRLVKQFSLQRNVDVVIEAEVSNSDSMQRLESGDADAFVNDDAVLLGLRASAKNPEDYVLLDGVSLSVQPYGLVMRNDDPIFKQLVDDTVIALMRSGEILKIYEKWFNQPIPPNNKSMAFPISDLNKATFEYPNDRPTN